MNRRDAEDTEDAEKKHLQERRGERNSPYTIFERRNVEVDEQAERITRDAKIGKQLSSVNRCQCIHSFQFNDNRLTNDKINSTRPNGALLVPNRDLMLSLKRDASIIQFHAERFFVD